MGLFSSKWAHAILVLVLAVGFVPGLASGQTGNATQVGGADDFAFGGCSPADPGPGQDAGGQVRISDKIAFAPPPGFDLRFCNLTFNSAPGLPGRIEILADVGGGGSGLDLVRDTPAVAGAGADAGHFLCSVVPPFLAPGFALPPKRGGKANEVIFESNPAGRPTLRLQVKSRGGNIEFAGLRIDRACIDRGNPLFVGYLGWPPAGTLLRTSFRLACGAPGPILNINYAATAVWRNTGPSAGCQFGPNAPDNGINIRTP
jgi:hypothetical protein